MIKTLSIAFILFGFSTATYADGMIIVNSSVGVSEITKNDVSKLYLGKKKRWDNDTKVILGYISNTAITGEDFYKSYIGRSSKKFKKHWVKQVFAGNGNAPQTFKTAAQAYSYVKSHTGALAYVPTSTSTDGVKVISIDGKSTY